MLAALPVAGFTTERRLSPVPTDPFTLGVASGDPAPDGVVIWTRLAPNPLADDGFGGMPARAVDVEWEVAADERFTRVEQRGMTTAARTRRTACTSNWPACDLAPTTSTGSAPAVTCHRPGAPARRPRPGRWRR